MLTGVLVAALALAVMPVDDAWGATIIDGPIDLGTAEPFAVLGASEITNTGPSVIGGDLGVSPGTAVTGFPPGLLSIGSAMYLADAVADQAQTDLGTAMATAASLTPTVSGLGNLTGMSLVPGVYSGGELTLDAAGTLTLAGNASSVWVFTAASTLVTGSASQILMTGGASVCNVFWRVGSSATLGTDSDFLGTLMAEQSITATNGTDVIGRLFAANGAVTLDTTDITIPSGCAAPGAVTSNGSPVFTSGRPTDATEGTPYAFTVTSVGTPAASYAVTSGALPSGLSLDGVTGEISGTPTTAGTSTFTLTASNATAPDASMIATILTVPAAAAVAPAALLPPTGEEPPIVAWAVAALLIAVGAGLRSRQSRRAS